MSNKRKHRPKRSKAVAVERSPEELAAAAETALAGGHPRDAIGYLKGALKVEERPEWRRLLASAYTVRARQLADKRMPQEALAMWDNRRAVVGDAPLSVEDASLLLRLGRTSEVVADYAACSDDADTDRRAGLRAALAPYLLANDEAFGAALPASDPLVSHLPAARAALEAYVAADGTALASALAQIPFRSPYRDWVQILKALDRLADHPKEAAALLARVPDHSSFLAVRRAAELALASDEAFLAELPRAGESTQRFAAKLRGWDDDRLRLASALAACDSRRLPNEMLQRVKQNRARIGEPWAHRYELRLTCQVNQSAKRPRRQRNASEDQLLVSAWYAEASGDPWDFFEDWRAYVDRLVESCTDGAGSDCAMRIALVLRHIARDGDMLSEEEDYEDPDAAHRTAASILAKSLEYDPDDRDTYIKLIEYYVRRKDLKDARRVLSEAQSRWPRDARVLSAALDTALASSAFKKAAGIARTILAIDPIHKGVREKLVNAHLAHARKQVRKKRSDLALGELDLAKEWGQRDRLRDRIDLLGALINWARSGGEDLGPIRALTERLGGGLDARLALALEAQALELDSIKILKRFDLHDLATPTRADLLAFFSRLREHAQEPLASNLRQYLNQTLESAATLNLSWSRTELETICESTERAGLNRARSAFARAALERFPGAPVFELHVFEAEPSADIDDIMGLRDAYDRARAEGDSRTAHRIAGWLERIGGHMPQEPRRPSVPVEEIIAVIGIDRTLDLLDVSRTMRREVKEMERDVGREGVVEVLAMLIKGAGVSLEDLIRMDNAKDANPDEPEKTTRQLDLFT